MWSVYLLALIPVSLVLAYAVHVPSVWVFASALLAIAAPLAEWTRKATDHLSRSFGPAVGGLLNVTFGNIPELILGLSVLVAGHPNVVKAQITGSIIGNGLLGLGLVIVVGCWGRSKLTFSRERTGLLASLLLLAVAVLALATLGVAWESELVAGAVEGTAGGLGVSPFFLGVVVLALVGNVAEYFGAVSFARRGRMELAMGISVGASVQVALLVAPLLVLISYFLGRPMDLIFGNPLELVAAAAVAFVVNAIASDGEATWFEGLLLLGVYAILALAFFFAAP